MSAIQLCGLFIHALSYHTVKDAEGNILREADRDLAAVGVRIFKGEEVMPLRKVSLLKAAYMQEVLKVTTSSYRGIKFLLEDEVWLPGVNAVGEYKRDTFRPELYRDVVPEGEERGFKGGPRYKLDSLLTHTVSERLQVEKEAGTEIGNKVMFNMTCGFDGCSSHSRYMMSKDTKSQLLGVCTVTDLWNVTDSGSKRLIWDCTDRGHNSIWNCRPLCVIPEQETRWVLKALMKGSDGVFGFDEEWKKIMRDGLTFTLPDDPDTVITAVLEKKPQPTGDGKMSSLCTGLGGAYCTLCKYSAADCKSRAMIAAGFPINRTMEEIEVVCRQLGADADTGLIPKSRRKTGDYPNRKGVIGESISELDWIHHLPVMHAPIHVLDWLCELIYRMNAHAKGVEHWVSTMIPGGPKRYDSKEWEKLDAAEKTVKEFVWDNLRISVFDAAKMATGNMFKIFKRDKNRELLSTLIKDSDEDEQKRKRDAWEKIHLQMCALSIVTRSQRTEVNVEAYKEVATDCYLTIVDEFPWAQISQTIHQLLSHAGQLMEEGNKNLGLGWMEESGVEAMQGQHKGWLLIGGRKTDPYDCMKDSLNHMVQASSPLMAPLHRLTGKRRQVKKKQDGSGKLWDLVNSLFVAGTAPVINFEEF